MALGYNPKDVDGGTPMAGKWPFRVVTVTEKTFSTGSRGIEVKFQVKTSTGVVTAYRNIVFPSGLWMLKQLCHATGVDFDPPPEPYEFEGKVGHADWDLEEFNNRMKMNPLEFYARPDHGPLPPAQENTSHPLPPRQAPPAAEPEPSPHKDGDMPPWPDDDDRLPF